MKTSDSPSAFVLMTNYNNKFTLYCELRLALIYSFIARLLITIAVSRGKASNDEALWKGNLKFETRTKLLAT